MNMLMENAKHPELGIRELFVDVLNGLIAGGTVSLGEQEYIVQRLLEEIAHEDDHAMCAYIFGLLKAIRDNGISRHVVTEAIVRRLPGLRPAGLAHAIAFIGSSNRADKMAVLAPYMNSADDSIRGAMADLLHSSGR